MKVLVAYQGASHADHPGVHDGFKRALAGGQIGLYESMFWRSNRTVDDWMVFWGSLTEKVRGLGIDWVLLHHFHDRNIHIGEGLRNLKVACPGVRICTSLGDPFGRFLYRVPSSFVEAARVSDVVFVTGFGYLARQLARAGVRNMVLMPLGYCQMRFGHAEQGKGNRDGIVFVGNRRLGRNPFHEMYWSGLRRVQLVEALVKRYGKRFHLYGRGWDGLVSWRGPLPFGEQGARYASAEAVFGGFPAVTYQYYSSNRHFIAMSEGALVVDYRVGGVERLLCPDRHWLLFRDKKELFGHMDSILDGTIQAMDEIIRNGLERVQAVFSKAALTIQAIRVWEQLDHGRNAHGAASIPLLDFVLPEFQGRESAHLFVHNWVG